ncbi:MAG: hypothetical protein J6O49_09400 [Bacteroidaceae bacterium]|nr:hypothetical protein [Bacteroidaceae bacterium]
MDTILTKTKHPLMTRDYCGGVNYSGGALMGGGTVGNPGVQPYKYGTKELDGERDKRTVPVSHLSKETK